MTYGEIKQLLRDDLSVETTDAFYTDALIGRAVNTAYRWLGALKNWPQTEMAYKRNTNIGQQYYNYPETFKSDSLRRLRFNNEEYTKKNFRLIEQRQDVSPVTAGERIFSDYKRQYFIYPTPSVVAEVAVWGHEIPQKMVNDVDEHVFADEADLEDILLKKAKALLYMKARGTMYERGQALDQEAKADAEAVWKLVKKNQAEYQTTDNDPMFNRIDVLNTAGINQGREPYLKGTFRLRRN